MIEDFKSQVVGETIDHWQKRSRPTAKKLEGRDIQILCCNAEKHSSSLFEVFHSDGDLAQWTYLGHGPFKNTEDYRLWLKSVSQNPLFEFYTIFSRGESQVLGVVCFTRIRPEHGSIEIAHVHFSKKLSNSRAATEVIYLMLSYVFDDLGYRRCEWKCDFLNEKSKRAAKRFGFTFEGTFRQDRVYKGRNRDTAWFSMTNKEWPDIKASFEKWLMPSNFDSSGKQLSSLSRMTASA